MRYAVSANTGFSWDFLIVALFTKIARWFLALAYGREVSLQRAFYTKLMSVELMHPWESSFLDLPCTVIGVIIQVSSVSYVSPVPDGVSKLTPDSVSNVWR